MSLIGMPDFGQALDLPEVEIYPPYGENGPYTLIPSRLVVANGEQGEPDFRLEYFRGEVAGFPPAPYALLDFRLQSETPTEAALRDLRGLRPQAALQTGAFQHGFLRLLPQSLLAGEDQHSAELRQPQPLVWNNLSKARSFLQLSPAAGRLVEESLAQGALPLKAVAEVELAGVVPRLAVKVSFNPFDLLSELNALTQENQTLAEEALVTYFQKELQDLPLEVEGEVTPENRALFAACMRDHVRQRFGRLAPAPEDHLVPHLALLSLEEAGAGRFTWDLSQPGLCWRPFVLTLSPFEALQAFVQSQGVDRLVHHSTVPMLDTGILPVATAANLPEQVQGLFSLGVSLHAPPNPPHRPQAIHQTKEFVNPGDVLSFRLLFSPVEAPAYHYQTFAVVRSAAGVETLTGPETPHSGSHLLLDVDDFPLDFYPIQAAPELLKIATLQVTAQWQADANPVQTGFALDDTHPQRTLSIPKNAQEGQIRLQVIAKDGSGSLTLGPLPPSGQQIGLYSLREYGPHHVAVTCSLEGDQPLLALEFLPGDLPDTQANRSVLTFTPHQPTRSWSWFSADPFHPGYRYRPFTGAGAVPGEWIEVQSPFEPLIVDFRKEPLPHG